MNKCNRWTVSY